jgi:SAM-dependent methyltransferase
MLIKLAKGIKRVIRHNLEREKFNPGFIGIFTNPFYFARKGLFQNLKEMASLINGKTLDVGCGQKPYRELFESSEYIGLELDSPENRANKRADYFYDGLLFPFRDEEFDSIITNQVLEHVFKPTEFLAEINRVLKQQGTLLLTVPFVWDEHEQPFDYARYSSFGISDLLKKSGFEILEQKKSMSDIRVIFQLINAYLYKKTAVKSSYINLLSTVFLMAPFNLLGEFLAVILPENEDLYLDNVILARKVQNS